MGSPEDLLAEARRTFEGGGQLDDITMRRLLRANQEALQTLARSAVPQPPTPPPTSRLVS